MTNAPADELPRLRALRPALDEAAARSRREIASALFGGDARAPTKLGRYELRQRISAGGMGVVWAAWDPTLSREVGIKLVRGPDPETVAHRQARFVREMRALALLNHPSVLPVYDVGSYDTDPSTGAAAVGLYMVTELVHGSTLDAWLGTPRERDEIFAMFSVVGDALASAHEAGLVHRDFKPANVLVGDDGRPRVIDFGLVRAVASESGSGVACTVPSVPALGEHMTGDATILGTPRFMAPEQIAGGPADARADQYAFCLVLAEALLHEPLFLAESAAALAKAKLAGPSRDRLRGVGLPAGVRRALERGLHPNPGRRHASMRVLLQAIARGRTRRRLLHLGIVGVVAAIGLAGALVDARDEPACAAGERLYIEDTRGGPAFAAFAEAWSAERDRVCAPDADRVATAATAECLRRQRDDFIALLDVLDESVTPPRVQHAATTLDDPARCTELVAAADTAKNTVVRSVEKEVASARALFSVGREADGIEVIDRAVDEAMQAGSLRLRAWVLDRSAELHKLAHRPDDAAALWERAYYEALRAGDGALAFRTASALAMHQASLLRDPWEAERWLRHAEAAVEAGVEPTPMQRADLHHMRAALAHGRGDVETAYAEMREALSAVEQDEHATPTAIAATRVDFGRLALASGRVEEAIASLQSGTAELEVILGVRSRQAIVARLGLGDALRQAGRLEDAKTSMQAVLERTTEGDPEHTYATWGLADLAWRIDGDAARALALYDDALAQLSAQPHPDAFDVAAVHVARGRIDLALGAATEAEDEATRAIAALEAGVGTDHPALVPALELLADAERLLGRVDDAARTNARAAGL